MRISLFILAVITLLYGIHTGLSTENTLRDWENWVASDSVYVKGFDTLLEVEGIRKMAREKAYNDAFLLAAANKEVKLVVNLNDSLVQLSVNGVFVHASKIKIMEIDPIFLNLSNQLYLKMFSVPLHLISENSTIVKEPIVVREAPKNPEEAALNAYKPDTLIQNPAFVKFDLDHQIRLILEQEENLTREDKWANFKFNAVQKRADIKDQLYNFVTFHDQKDNPTIRIKVPIDELRAIYRAIPTPGEVVLYF